MTATTTTSTVPDLPGADGANCALYRDIHKGIRAELFAVTGDAGCVDPADRGDREALAGNIAAVAEVLASHAEHEDTVIEPVMRAEFPAMAAQVEADHAALEAHMAAICRLADTGVRSGPASERADAHRLHLELASFTSAYLAHQDFEERTILPALWDAVGPSVLLDINRTIVASIPPQQMAQSLAFMLPAMNVVDRTELLGGIRAEAPAGVFEQIWGLTVSVLAPSDAAAVAERLGVA